MSDIQQQRKERREEREREQEYVGWAATKGGSRTTLTLMRPQQSGGFQCELLVLLLFSSSARLPRLYILEDTYNHNREILRQSIASIPFDDHCYPALIQIETSPTSPAVTTPSALTRKMRYIWLALAIDRR